jgi:site-specific DNA-methyltransferase (adenine-specific)
MEADELSNIQIIHGDSLEAMKAMPDKAYELAIVDPMYQNKDAIGIVNSNGHCANRKEYKTIANKAPDETYFGELRRVSKNQIVWGGNYFGLRGGYIFWNKNQTCFGDGELAYCSMINQVKYFEYTWNGMIQQNMKQKEFRIHPTQKPVALYQWLLKNYAKPGDKILDTHGGSCSSAIACDIMGFDATIYEIDEDYYKAAVERFDRHKQQQVLEFG